MTRQRILFLCTHNSARSQMAEGWLRAIANHRFEVQSAGTERTDVHTLAIRAMAERNIDISGHTSKALAGLMQQPWDYVITVCDEANEQCPLFLGTAKRLHWSFPDPSRASGTEQERLEVFRSVRDAIATQIQHWLTTDQAGPGEVTTERDKRLRQRAQHLMDAEVLSADPWRSRENPPAPRGPLRSEMPPATATRVVRCVLCNEPGADVALQDPVRTALTRQVHRDPCLLIWTDEARRRQKEASKRD